MRFVKRSSAIALSCIIFTFGAYAQSKNISGEFHDMKFPAFVKAIEARNACHFYYDETALDSFAVNITITNQTLPEALTKIFTNTPFHFSIDALNHVFITKDKKLETTVAADFFIPGATSDSVENETSQKENVKKEKPKIAFVENKLFEIGSKRSVKKNNSILLIV